MNKNTRKYMIGTLLGFVGMMMYTIGLEGFEYIDIMDILDMLRQVAVPFILTELWVMIGVEGCRNIKQQLIEFKAKLIAKKAAKEMKAE